MTVDQITNFPQSYPIPPAPPAWPSPRDISEKPPAADAAATRLDVEEPPVARWPRVFPGL